MAISSINNAYNYSFTGLGSTEKDKETAAAKDSDKSNSSASSAKAKTSNALLSQVFKELRAQGVERITYDVLDTYRMGLEKSFSDRVRSDLKKAGVDPNIDFKLVSKADGSIEVVTKHTDKAKVEEYFKENPEMVEQFNTIQALSNLKKGTSSNKTANALHSLQDIKKGLQAEAVQAFFSTMEGGMSSQIADFANQSLDAKFMLGLNMFA